VTERCAERVRGHENGPRRRCVARRRGGTGTDRLFGGPGRDDLEAADGQRDTVDCGPGPDVARVDGFDRVSGCERVIRN
jgi:hypothetical protein